MIVFRVIIDGVRLDDEEAEHLSYTIETDVRNEMHNVLNIDLTGVTVQALRIEKDSPQAVTGKHRVEASRYQRPIDESKLRFWTSWFDREGGRP